MIGKILTFFAFAVAALLIAVTLAKVTLSPDVSNIQPIDASNCHTLPECAEIIERESRND